MMDVRSIVEDLREEQGMEGLEDVDAVLFNWSGEVE
jgi:hypothetical protein